MVLVILPSALCIGATFPFAVRIHTPSAAAAGQATARIYAWNTAGAIAGSVLAGFYLLPALGFTGSVHLAVAINLALALAALALIARPPVLRTVVLGCISIVLIAIYRPAPPTRLLDSSIIDEDRGGQVVYSAIGRSSTVLVKEYQGGLHLRTNGLPEAGIRTKAAPPFSSGQHWLMTLPLIARPEATSALAVGLGGGVLLEDLPPSLRTIDVVELEAEVVAANRRIGPLRHTDPMADPRIQVVINDARNALALTTRRYDLIVSQPSHPWTSGASHLYTNEFVALVKRRLHRDGVFVQWMSSNFANVELLRSLCATLGRHFQRLRLYQSAPGTFLLLASDGTLELEKNLLRADAGSPQWRRYLQRSGVHVVEDLLVALTLDEVGARDFAGRDAPITDDYNRLATAGRYRPDKGEDPTFFEHLQPYDPLLRKTSWIHRELNDLHLVYIGRRLIEEGFGKRAFQLTEQVVDAPTGYQIQGYGLLNEGKPAAAATAFARAMEVAPDNYQAAYARILPYLRSIGKRPVPEQIAALIDQLPPSGQAVIEGRRLGNTNDWVGLAALDQQLATTQQTDAWYLEAVLLRAYWRTFVIPKERNDAVLLEAQALLDGQLDRAHVVELLYPRQKAALLRQDAAAYIATTWRVINHFEVNISLAETDRYRFDATRKATARKQFQKMVETLTSKQFATQENTAELRTYLRTLLRKLGTI